MKTKNWLRLAALLGFTWLFFVPSVSWNQDYSLVLLHSSNFAFFPVHFPGDGCSGMGSFTIRTRWGRLLFNSGEEVLACLPSHAFLPGKILMAGKAPFLSPVFLDANGDEVRSLTPAEFDEVIAQAQTQYLHGLDLIQGVAKAFAAPYMIERAVRLRAATHRDDRALGLAIAQSLPAFAFGKAQEDLYESIFASQNLDDGEMLFLSLYQEAPARKFFAALDRYFPAGNPANAATRANLISQAANLTDATKKRHLFAYFDSKDPEVANAATSALIRLGETDRLLPTLWRRFYAAKGFRFGDRDQPANYLEPILRTEKASEADLRRAARFALAHPEENFWMEGLELLEQRPYLKEKSFLPLLEKLRKDQAKELYIPKRIDALIQSLQGSA